MSSSHSERVLVVPSAELDRLGRFQGFSPDADRYLRTLLVPELARFLPRSEVEDDPSYKQIIAYVVFRCADSVFCYTRGKSQGEARLHRLRSIGVGGHVDESDADGRATFEAYEMAMNREINEEIALNSQGDVRLVGLINDDSSPVGQVHLGAVHLYELEQPLIQPREEGLAEAEFISIADLIQNRVQFETWSQICIEGFLNPPADA